MSCIFLPAYASIFLIIDAGFQAQKAKILKDPSTFLIWLKVHIFMKTSILRYFRLKFLETRNETVRPSWGKELLGKTIDASTRKEEMYVFSRGGVITLLTFETNLWCKTHAKKIQKFPSGQIFWNLQCKFLETQSWKIDKYIMTTWCILSLYIRLFTIRYDYIMHIILLFIVMYALLLLLIYIVILLDS